MSDDNDLNRIHLPVISNTSDDSLDEGCDDSRNSDWMEVNIDPVLHNFTGKAGLRVNLPRNISILDAFCLLLGDFLMQKIANWINARALLLYPIHAFSMLQKEWKPTSVKEIKQSLGLYIAMGNIRPPTIMHSIINLNLAKQCLEIYIRKLFAAFASMTKCVINCTAFVQLIKYCSIG